jgi:RNA polymerase sigma factor (sigma-70 family)
MHQAPNGKSFDAVLDAARAGQGWAWAAIYRDLSPAVLGYLRARGAPEPDDVGAEVFLHVVRDLRWFKGKERDFRAWVLTIAHNRLVDERRSVKRRPVEVIPVEEIEHGEVSGSAEEDALAKISEQRACQVLGRLNDDQQSVILLRVLGDLSITQVAAVLGRTPGAVKALQRRGLATLKRELSSLRVSS